MKKHLLLTAGLLLALNYSHAQWYLFVDTKIAHENNLLRFYRPITDQLIAPQLGISYIGSTYELFYNAELTQLTNQTQYNYQTHLIGIDFFKEDNPKIKSTWGINFAARLDQPVYSYYDYYQLNGYFNLTLNYTDWSMLKLGSEVYRKLFPEEKAWNHWETRLFLWQNFYLPTHSTLKLAFDYLVRDFAAVPLQSGEYDWSTGTYLDSLTSRQAELPTLNQLVGTLRWAQSFTPKLGGYTELNYRYNTSRGNPYQLEQVSFSPIDDYFGYRGYTWLNNLKWKVSKRLWARASWTYYELTYINRPVYAYDFTNQTWLTDSNGELIELAPVRQDHGSTIEVNLGLRLENLFEKASQLEIVLNLTRYANRSNDPYFAYRDYGLGARLNYDFQW